MHKKARVFVTRPAIKRAPVTNTTTDYLAAGLAILARSSDYPVRRSSAYLPDDLSDQVHPRKQVPGFEATRASSTSAGYNLEHVELVRQRENLELQGHPRADWCPQNL